MPEASSSQGDLFQGDAAPPKVTPKPPARKPAKAKDTSTAMPEAGSLARLPKRISPSRLKDFMQCPKLFYYKTILGIPTPNTIHTARGTLAHTACELIFDHEKGTRDPDTAVSYVRPAWKVMIDPLAERDAVEVGSPEEKIRTAYESFRDLVPAGSKKEKQMLDSAKDYVEVVKREAAAQGSTPDEVEEELLSSSEEMVRLWYGMETPDKFDPTGRELHLQAKTAGTTLHGFIDRLDVLSYPDGSPRVMISDYKTGKVPGEGKNYRPQVQARIEDEAFFAMKVYALLYYELHKVVPDQLRLLYVRKGDQSGVKKLNITPSIVNQTRKQVTALWKQITSAAKTEVWEPKTGPLCNWCYFQDVCPAFNDGVDRLLPEAQALRGEPVVDEADVMIPPAAATAETEAFSEAASDDPTPQEHTAVRIEAGAEPLEDTVDKDRS